MTRSKYVHLPGIALIGLCGLAGGLLWGWLAWGRNAGLSARGGEVQGQASRAGGPVERGTPPAASATAADIVSDWETVNALSPEAFAVYMADAWLKVGDPQAQLRRALCMMVCDTDRAMAFYQEFKKRKGLTLKEDAAELRELITMVARKDGRHFLERMLQLAPSGAGELDSLIHGWASADPPGSVEWINALPDNSPIYAQMLKGLLWGIGENSPTTAAKVFQTLAPADRNDDTIHSVSESTFFYHGLTGLNEMLAGVADAGLRRELATATGTGLAMRSKPSEYVQQMAAHLTVDNPRLQGCYTNMAQRWVQAAPQEALDWLQQEALGPANEAALAAMTRQLINTGSHAAVSQWIVAHPEAPGAAAIQRTMTGAVR
jgi:hypothetical protein